MASKIEGPAPRESEAGRDVEAATLDTSPNSAAPVAAQEHVKRVIEKVETSDITVGPRLRQVDDATVRGIAKSMGEVGQLQPVTVRFKGDSIALVAGLGRLKAAKWLGWKWIDAVIIEADDLDAQIIEVDENLMRKELSPDERRAWFLKRKELWEAKRSHVAHHAPHGEQRKGDGTFAKGNVKPKGFAAEMAEVTGLTKSQVNRIIAEPTPDEPKPQPSSKPKLALAEPKLEPKPKPSKAERDRETVKEALLHAHVTLQKAGPALGKLDSFDLDNNEKFSVNTMSAWLRVVKAKAHVFTARARLDDALATLKLVDVFERDHDLAVLDEIAAEVERIRSTRTPVH